MIEEKPYRAENYFEINAEDEAEEGWDGNVETKTALPTTPKQKGMKGMIYMLISSVTASLMAFILKELYLNSNITAFEVTYW
jgi:drug/metabolite transporter (DMT)-like permease